MLDPAEIFAKTPNLKNAPNDLWNGQAEALREWHKDREAHDTVIALNTGAGKSIVGILIAQSLVNEAIGRIVIACSTIDLVRQTARECDRIGIKYTERVQSQFSNDLYETGQSFCITTYQALFAPIGAFRDQNTPAGIVFDDAHVAERLIRDSCTLTIAKEHHPVLFSKIIDMVRPSFELVNKGPHLQYVLEDVGQQTVTLCPPSTAFRCKDQLIQSLKDANYRKDASLFFPTVRLFENFANCAIFISSREIEITPPFVPTGAFPFFGSQTRRVYLSATLDFATDFVRGFGRLVSNRIVPTNDAGNGERLILLSSDFDKIAEKLPVAQALLTKHKVLVSVPSYRKALPWRQIGHPPEAENFSKELESFRAAGSGAFILVSRIDGIDLPQDTCRIMVIDGAPMSASIMETYLFYQLGLSNLNSTKMAGRIAQLLGRINRGRSDYGAFILYGRDLTNWIKTERNVALLPELIRKQVILGSSLQRDIGPSTVDAVSETVEQVLSRDPGWLAFYRDTIDGLEVSSDALERVKDREEQLAKSAVAECRFMTLLWQGNIEGARKAILDVLDDTALADAKLAGWYSIWLGMTYENDGDMETAVAHYKMARARLSSWLNVPIRSARDIEALGEELRTPVQERLISVNHHGPQALGDLLAKLRAQARILEEGTASPGAQEEALRHFGELMGFKAGRPDNEVGMGPDVVWYDESQGYILAFELKTGKDIPATYNKNEIGQAHNHLQWLADEEFKDLQNGGLLVVGPSGTCTAEASPSDQIFVVEPKAVTTRMNEFIAKVEDTRGRTAIERWVDLRDLGALPEWQLTGWWAALALRQMRSLKVK